MFRILSIHFYFVMYFVQYSHMNSGRINLCIYFNQFNSIEYSILNGTNFPATPFFFRQMNMYHTLHTIRRKCLCDFCD